MCCTLICLLLLVPSQKGASARQAAPLPAWTPLEYYDARLEADALLERSDYTGAAALYARLAHEFPQDGENWLRLGTSHYYSRSYPEAVAAYERALELGFGNTESTTYNVACCHALMGEADQAFAWLERALAVPFENRAHLQRDSDLNGLHDDPRWRDVAGLAPEEELDLVEGWRFDLAHLAREMERLHVDQGQAAPLEEVRAALDALHARIPSLAEDRIPVQFQRVMRLLGDGHSVVYPVSDRLASTELPLTFYWFPEGLYVVAAQEHPEWVGARVVEIGRGKAQDFAEDLEALVTRDNPMGILWLGPKYLKMSAVLLDLGYVDASDSIPLTLEIDGVLERIEVEPVPLQAVNQKLVAPGTTARVPRYLERIGDNYWMEELESGVLYVQYNQVRDKSTETLAAFSVRLRERVAAGDIDHLIVDVRHNNGGNSYLNTELVRSLVHFETTRPQGQLYVLMGRNTFSAAQNFLTDVDRWTRPLYVGEPSGSRPNMVGEDTEVVLPFSGTRASISSVYHQQSWPGDDRIWIVPQVPVALTAEAYFAGHDPALEATLELIQR